MIRVRKLISRTAGGANRQLSIHGIAGVTIAARDLERAVDFYSRVFGFRVAGQRRSQPRRSATLAAAGEALIAIQELGDGPDRPVPLHRRWGFLVDDLDRVREAVWDLGVKVADDNGAPDHIHRWSNGRSLRVRDPDGNEIELVEECPVHAAGTWSRRCPARRAWRGRFQPTSCHAR